MQCAAFFAERSAQLAGQIHATKPCQHVTGSDMCPEHVSQFSHQWVTGDMSTGIIDQLKAIQIRLTMGVFGGALPGNLHYPVEAAVKLPSIDEAGQCIMAGPADELLGNLIKKANVTLRVS